MGVLGLPKLSPRLSPILSVSHAHPRPVLNGRLDGTAQGLLCSTIQHDTPNSNQFLIRLLLYSDLVMASIQNKLYSETSRRLRCLNSFHHLHAITLQTLKVGGALFWSCQLLGGGIDAHRIQQLYAFDLSDQQTLPHSTTS